MCTNTTTVIERFQTTARKPYNPVAEALSRTDLSAHERRYWLSRQREEIGEAMVVMARGLAGMVCKPVLNAKVQPIPGYKCCHVCQDSGSHE